MRFWRNLKKFWENELVIYWLTVEVLQHLIEGSLTGQYNLLDSKYRAISSRGTQVIGGTGGEEDPKHVRAQWIGQ